MKRISRVYSEMKRKHGQDVIILFHVGHVYRAFFQDAKTISNILGVKCTIKLERNGKLVMFISQFVEDIIEEQMNKLLDSGLGVCVSETRDSKGIFVLN